MQASPEVLVQGGQPNWGPPGRMWKNGVQQLPWEACTAANIGIEQFCLVPQRGTVSRAQVGQLPPTWGSRDYWETTPQAGWGRVT